MFPKKLLLLVGTLFASLGTTIAGPAATFHVSNSAGDDANPGTVTAPWRSFAKVGATAFKPGDTILLKRGDIWPGETLTVSSSGSAEARITFGAYGAGAKPVIDPTGEKSPGILISGKKYVTVRDLVVRRGDGGVRCLADSAHIELLRLDVSDTKGPGIVLRQSSFILVDGCTVTRAGNNGILMHGSAAEPKVNNCVVQNCIVSDLGSNDGIVIHQDMAGNGAGSDFVLRNNISYNCPEQGFDITTGSHVLLEDNVTYGNHGGAITIGHVANHVTVRRHRSENEPTAGSNSLIIQVPFVTVEHSRFIGPVDPNPGKNVALVSIAIGSESEPEDVRLLNNVFLWNSTRPGQLLATSNKGFKDAQGVPKRLQLQRLEIRNNILASRTATPGTISFRDMANPLSSPGFVFDHNLYQSPDPAGMQWLAEGKKHDFAAYRAATDQDAHGLEADPKFVSAIIGDFRLQTGSPAIDAGTETGGGVDSASERTDAGGVAVPQGKAPDIGAYEASVADHPLPAPVNLSAPPLARTATTAVLLWDRPAGGEGIDSYQIFCDGELVGETTKLSFTAHNLTPGRMHRFAVRSCRSPGISSRQSDPVVVLTKAAGPVLNVREHGARGDGVTKDTAAIQKAITDCPPGGTVLVPPGVYLVDHLDLKSDLTLELAAGALLQFLPREMGHYPDNIEMLSSPDGPIRKENFALISAVRVKNLTITGGGRINGMGESWWPIKPLPRPRLIKLIDCSDVFLQGITLEDPPSWNTHMIYVDRAVISEVTFLKVSTAHGTNGDGLDPESCRDLLVVGCRFGNQDDSIAIKSGTVSAARPQRQRASEDITIRDCLVDGSLAPGAHPLGFAIGSENSGGIRRVLIKDCVFRNAASVANLKSNRERPGAVIEDIRVEDCTYTNTEFGDEPWNRAPLAIDLFYYRLPSPPDSVEPLTAATPVFRNIHFKNITIDNPRGRFAYFCGLAEQPTLAITLENVTGSAKTGLHGQNLDGIELRNVTIKTQSGPPLTWVNTKNLIAPTAPPSPAR